jgi:hypothetical protein
MSTTLYVLKGKQNYVNYVIKVNPMSTMSLKLILHQLHVCVHYFLFETFTLDCDLKG